MCINRHTYGCVCVSAQSHPTLCDPLDPHREKEMATYSNILAWRIPGMEEPGGLPSMGSHRVGYD